MWTTYTVSLLFNQFIKRNQIEEYGTDDNHFCHAEKSCFSTTVSAATLSSQYKKRPPVHKPIVLTKIPIANASYAPRCSDQGSKSALQGGERLRKRRLQSHVYMTAATPPHNERPPVHKPIVCTKIPGANASYAPRCSNQGSKSAFQQWPSLRKWRLQSHVYMTAATPPHKKKTSCTQFSVSRRPTSSLA